MKGPFVTLQSCRYAVRMGQKVTLQQLDELSDRDFERLVGRILKARGFSAVHHVEVHREFGADFTGTLDGTRYVIQARRGVGLLEVDSIQQILGGMAYHGADRCMVVADCPFSLAAQELAKRAGVDLVDRTQFGAWLGDIEFSEALGEVEPRPHQVAALERLADVRQRGDVRALAVMASGLGKTYLAALDAAQFEKQRDRPIRVLYLSHQHIILEQGREAFRRVFGPARSFGLFVGGQHDMDVDFVFGTFQSIEPILESIDPATFEYVVIDEAHHSAAPTRDRVVQYLTPEFMLGLTATDFRGDGKDIYSYYDDVVAASLPLERALVDGLLTPISYRVFTDPIDAEVLRDVFRDPEQRPKDLFTPAPDASIVGRIHEAMAMTDTEARVLIFCASLRQMDHFQRLIPKSRTISSRDSRTDQLSTVEEFREGKFQVLLSRDVLNEGIDVPHATTIVFLRNTESPVVFLQQLGRGLRRIEGKRRVDVLDFVANLDRIEFVYSLFSRLRTEIVRREAVDGHDQWPESISIELDETSRDVVKELIAKKAAIGGLADLYGLSGALDFEVSTTTLRHIVQTGRLIPDFVVPNGEPGPMYFKLGTVHRFMRQVGSPRFTEGLIPLREFAQLVGERPKTIRDRQQKGFIPASWVHRPAPGHVDLFFTPRDVDGVIRTKGRESLRAEARGLSANEDDRREKEYITALMEELAPAEPPA